MSEVFKLVIIWNACLYTLLDSRSENQYFQRIVFLNI